MTPLTVDRIPEGEATLEMTLEGCEPYKQTVKLAAGEAQELRAVLKPIPAELKVVSIPPGARIYIDTQFRGEAPVTAKDLAPGSYRVRAELVAHEPVARTVELTRAQKLVEEFRLESNSGLFQLISKEVIRRDEVVVVNCSGHTFPVEKHLLGEEWAKTVELPADAPALEEGLLGSLEHLDRSVRRIAILEDDPSAALLLRRILQARRDYQIFEARDGRIGLEMIRRERPDVILLDLMMPELDGFGVLEALRADQELQRIPVVVVTAKELTPSERARLSGQIRMLFQKGSFAEGELLQQVLDALKGEGA